MRKVNGWRFLFLVALLIFWAQNLYFFSRTNFLSIDYSGIVEAALSDKLGTPPLAVLWSVIDMPYYPPLWWATMWMLSRVFGLAILPYVVFVWLLWTVAAFVCAKLVGLVAGSRDRGWFAAALLLLSPASVTMSKDIFIEQAFVPLVPLTIYALFRSRGFIDRRWSLLTGLFAGLGFLVKWSFAAYVAPAFAIECMALLRRGDETVRQKQLANFLVLVIAAAAVCVWWYAMFFNLPLFLETAKNDPVMDAGTFTLRLLVNLSFFVNSFFGIGLLLLLLCIVALFMRPPNRLYTVLVLNAVLTLFVFSIPVHVEDRYVLPLVPLIAAAFECALLRVGGRLSRGEFAAVQAGLLITVASFSVLIYMPRAEASEGEIVVHRFSNAGALHWYRHYAHDILARVDEVAGLVDERIVVGVHPVFSGVALPEVALKREWLLGYYNSFEMFLPLRGAYGYAGFSRKLHKKFFRVVLVNEKWANRYRGVEQVLRLHDPLLRYVSRAYVDQSGLGRVPPLSLVKLNQDLDFLQTYYILYKRLLLPTGDVVQVWVERGFARRLGLSPSDAVDIVR